MEVALVLGGLATIGKYLSKDEKPPVSQVATYPQSQPIPTWDAPQEMNPAMPVFKDKQASIPNFTEQEHLMSGTYSRNRSHVWYYQSRWKRSSSQSW